MWHRAMAVEPGVFPCPRCGAHTFTGLIHVLAVAGGGSSVLEFEEGLFVSH